MKRLKREYRITIALTIVGWVFFVMGQGTDQDLYLGLATEITGAGFIIALLAAVGISPENEDITELQKELAEVKALLMQQNTPTESD